MLSKRVINKIRTTIYLFITIYCITLCVFKPKAESEEVAGRATVKSDSLIVYSRISSASEMIKKLEKGDVVTVEFEFEGAEGSWCGIMEEGQITISGYVQ